MDGLACLGNVVLPTEVERRTVNEMVSGARADLVREMVDAGEFDGEDVLEMAVDGLAADLAGEGSLAGGSGGGGGKALGTSARGLA